jgi:hypothetical protein
LGLFIDVVNGIVDHDKFIECGRTIFHLIPEVSGDAHSITCKGCVPIGTVIVIENTVSTSVQVDEIAFYGMPTSNWEKH